MSKLTQIVAVVYLVGCAKDPGPVPGWAPVEHDGWKVHEIEAAEAPSWVLYDRESDLADVKELRIVGLVDAAPEVAIEAVRERLFDPQYLPKGLEREILVETDDEIVVYGLMPAPFPMKDREATEQMVFSTDAATGVHRMEGREVDVEEPPPPGVLRIPLARNVVILEPHDGGSVLTNDSVHDIGGNFPNWTTYGPVRKQLVEDLHIVRELSR